MTSHPQVPTIPVAPRRVSGSMTSTSQAAGFTDCAAESFEDTAQRTRRLVPSGRRVHLISAYAQIRTGRLPALPVHCR